MFSVFVQGEKKNNQGWVLTWQLLHCSSYCRAQAVGRGRALHGADAVKREEGTTPNPALGLPTAAAAGDCPALLWFQHQSPVSTQSSLPRALSSRQQLEPDSRNAPQIHFATQGGFFGAPLTGAA